MISLFGPSGGVTPGSGIVDKTYDEYHDDVLDQALHGVDVPEVLLSGTEATPYFYHSSPWENPGAFLPVLRPGNINSPEAVSEAKSILDDVEPTPSTDRADYSDLAESWLSQLFETSEHAALLQAERNERSAVAAYLRSEQAADNALKRARALRQTAYQDAVQSLKAAGLNPVLAAGGGISGSSTTAPQANAPSSSSSIANGLNAADLLTAIAALISSAGNIMKGISSFLPTTLIKG